MEIANLMAAGGSSAPSMLKRKRTAGRRKIPIERIENQDARRVCFSKRRSSLFRKAKELSVLCGAHVEVIAFSPAGNPFTCAYPSNSHSMIAKYLSSEQVDQNVSISNSQSALSREVSELTTRIEAARRKKEIVEATVKGIREDIWSADVAKMELAELEALKKSLEQVRTAMGLYSVPVSRD